MGLGNYAHYDEPLLRLNDPKLHARLRDPLVYCPRGGVARRMTILSGGPP